MGFFPPVCSNFNNPEASARRFFRHSFRREIFGPTEPPPRETERFPAEFPKPYQHS